MHAFNTHSTTTLTPLAELVRPKCLDDVYGQRHILTPDKPLWAAVVNRIPHSMVFWGPPGSGKTTLARIISQAFNARLLTLSAVESGIKEIRHAIDEGKKARMEGQAAVLFVDEVHRFNRTQQDAFLPHIECGDLIFVGATTENPSFELNGALLSRLKVYVLRQLEFNDLLQVIDRCMRLGAGSLPPGFDLDDDARKIFAHSADGDARRVLNFIEVAAGLIRARESSVVTKKMATEIVGQPLSRFDKGRDVFFELTSALHKAVRGSDPDASLYWFARLLAGGCDPLYVARRVVRIASEDIGNADPNALNLALNAWDTCQRLGTPEGELALAQAVVYLACCPKSNAVYAAFNAAREDAKRHGHLEVPMHLRNAPTRMMKNLGYGENYRYAHDEPGGYALGEEYFPSGMNRKIYYRPVARGIEKRIKAHMENLRRPSDSKTN